MPSPSPAPRAPLLRWWVAALAVLFVAAVRLPRPASVAADLRARQAQAQLVELEKALTGFHDVVGRLPDALGELTPEGPEEVFFLRRIPPDPWGRPYRYQVDEDGLSAHVSSAGPDGRPDTPDDIRALTAR